MKNFVIILCSVLAVLLIVWLVMRFNNPIIPGAEYQASTRREKIKI